jgi:ribosomal protein S18 acetylase RimI-like enzyme
MSAGADQHDDVVIEPYRDRDEEQVVGLWRSCFAAEDLVGRNEPRASIRRKLGVQRELFFVARAAGRIVGTAMAGYDGHRGWIYSLAVHPDQRRRGIGRALLRRAEAALAGLGCPKVNLQVRATNRDVIAFYERCGFIVEERVSMGKISDGAKGGAAAQGATGSRVVPGMSRGT